MVRYSNAKGLVFRLKEEYPVYDENENIVGHTDVNDIAVVLYDAGEQDSYFEAVLATGKHAGYDGLALNLSDLKKAQAIVFVPIAEDECVYLRKTKLNVKGEQNHVG